MLCAVLSFVVGLPLALLLSGCGGGSPGADACHAAGELVCTPDAPTLADGCALFFAGDNPDPFVCEGVTPAGNCLPLDEFTRDDTASCNGGEVEGMVWCCGEPSSASCLPFDDAACTGASAEELAGRCEVAFGETWATPYTCAAGDGPATCKNLSRFKETPLTACDGVDRFVYCCTTDGL